MIKLVSVQSLKERVLRLRFSDGSWGDYDFAAFIAADTKMTRPLADGDFFRRHFIEAGALAWPNGFDLSAGSLHRRLAEADALRRDSEAA